MKKASRKHVVAILWLHVDMKTLDLHSQHACMACCACADADMLLCPGAKSWYNLAVGEIHG